MLKVLGIVAMLLMAFTIAGTIEAQAKSTNVVTMELTPPPTPTPVARYMNRIKTTCDNIRSPGIILQEICHNQDLLKAAALERSVILMELRFLNDKLENAIILPKPHTEIK